MYVENLEDTGKLTSVKCDRVATRSKTHGYREFESVIFLPNKDIEIGNDLTAIIIRLNELVDGVIGNCVQDKLHHKLRNHYNNIDTHYKYRNLKKMTYYNF